MRSPNRVVASLAGAVLRVRRPLLALIVLVALLAGGYLVNSSGSDSGSPPHTRSVQLSSLPSQVGRTIDRIEGHSRLPYRQDGSVFDNREHLLPEQKHGYYHEYTVPTPDENDRGERRLVIGTRNEIYYTDDHYESFVRISPGG